MDTENTAVQAQSDILKFNAEGKFKCIECHNEVKIQVSTEEGLADADLAKVQLELTEHPEKIMFGVCPVCGMEYQFMLVNKKTEKTTEAAETVIPTEGEAKKPEKELAVKPSDEEK